ncbi:EAL domain-containing protein [Evansella sp. AB-P1]|uniref:GGDEF and EAL domain-containing protein n=1 Tax=Evansella sp. AB-P1 TaxID=3037653 RepID=UPI00241F8B51|nr:GGDEF and EAL domain-containing protein [Evansella sp. AB-P1]MDG5786814.1 EAL domain-containing protein [Evansella sp. AB-P1]
MKIEKDKNSYSNQNKQQPSHYSKRLKVQWDESNEICDESILLLNKVFEEALPMLVTNESGEMLYVSDTYCDLFEVKENEILGKHYLSIHHSLSNEDRDTFFEAILKDNKSTFELKHQTNSGEMIITKTSVIPIKLRNEKKVYLLLYQNITDLKEVKRLLQEMIVLDTLTGLPNRDKFEQDIAKEMNKIQTDSVTNRFAIYFIDLDRFKYYNDTLGHLTGDCLLQEIARALRSLQDDRIKVYRYGGDEFSIIFRQISSEDEIQAVATEILNIFQSPFFVKGNELFLTTSIGVSHFPSLGKTYDEIIHQGEMAKQYAKEQGKGSFALYTPCIRTKHDKNLLVEKRLRLAVENQGFQLHYQPQIDLRKKEVIGVEALIRWTDEKLGQITPGFFIPLAEKTGLINPIGDWVLEEAMRQGKEWYDKGIYLRIGINISPIQFVRHDFVWKVKEILRKTKLPPYLLDLEITENDLLYNRDECFKTLEKLRNTGISISIDDFGTGYSSLSYLRKFPINSLKIDQSFIREVIDNSNDQAIVSSIIQLAHNMNLRVIAEGVETTDMVEFLDKLDCDEMQGYLYSKPLPASEVIDIIEGTNVSNVLHT